MKLKIETALIAYDKRRPFAGAWIETDACLVDRGVRQGVAPSRGRGLKP